MNAIIISDNAECQRILLAVGLHDKVKPTPPFTAVHTQFTHDGYFWLAVNHVGLADPADNGYLLCGLPEAVGAEVAAGFFAEVIAANATSGLIFNEAVEQTNLVAN